MESLKLATKVQIATCFAGVLILASMVGCGSSKMTNTTRTATEQLLLSDAMDRAVSRTNFNSLVGKKVYLDAKPIEKITDSPYLLSIVRQHAFASGCRLVEKVEDAEVIIELRAGTSGTDQSDTLFGISEMTIPSLPGYAGGSIPEVPIAKKTIQKAVVKIGLFAYDAKTQEPLWQSGNLVAESSARNRWFLGMGPFQTGEIYDTAAFDGKPVEIPLIDLKQDNPPVPVGNQVFFSNSTTRADTQITEALPPVETESTPDTNPSADAILPPPASGNSLIAPKS